MAKKPVPLVALTTAGFTQDGQKILFEFEAINGKKFAFLVPHYAMSAVITRLQAVSEGAAALRMGAATVPSDKFQAPPAMMVEEYQVAVSDDAFAIVLSLKAANDVRLDLALPADLSVSLCESLSNAQEEIRKRSKRSTH